VHCLLLQCIWRGDGLDWIASGRRNRRLSSTLWEGASVQHKGNSGDEQLNSFSFIPHPRSVFCFVLVEQNLTCVQNAFFANFASTSRHALCSLQHFSSCLLQIACIASSLSVSPKLRADAAAPCNPAFTLLITYYLLLSLIVPQ
jgi:hypothetical protein